MNELDWSARWFYALAHLRRTSLGWRDEEPESDLLEVLGPTAGHLLDVGCGSGRHTIAAATAGWRATGIDLFARPLARARKHAARANVDVAFIRDSALRIHHRFEVGSVDVALDVLGPAGDLQTRYLAAYGKALRTVIRPGGRFILRSFLDEPELEPLLAAFHSMERSGPWLTARVAQTPVVE